jgi:hypothetical protein
MQGRPYMGIKLMWTDLGAFGIMVPGPWSDVQTRKHLHAGPKPR